MFVARMVASRSAMASRSFVTRTTPMFADKLPYHLVVGLPALSPTMESGSLSEWNVKEGDSFAAGDLLAKIETDKASMDFEAQDDGVVAKILTPAGSGRDIALGEPIMVTVEDEADVAAFADFTVPEGSGAPPPAAAAPPPPPKETAPPPKAAPAPTPPPPPPPVAAAAPVAPAPTTASIVFPSVDTTSPLAKILAQQQKDYIAKYGTSYYKPLLEEEEENAAA